ncbi:hypothetical protein D1007_20691 [Hordeum vulgare]|nr:hypothetical protein D1007_20691 [Hordeum vulgare]
MKTHKQEGEVYSGKKSPLEMFQTRQNPDNGPPLSGFNIMTVAEGSRHHWRRSAMNQRGWREHAHSQGSSVIVGGIRVRRRAPCRHRLPLRHTAAPGAGRSRGKDMHPSNWGRG